MAHVPQAIRDELLSIPGVTTVSQNLTPDGEIAVGVERNVPSIVDNIPLEIDGFPVNIKKETGTIGIESLMQDSITAQHSTRERHRPVELGVSIGTTPPPGTIAAGSLGWAVTDGNENFLMTNYHVLAENANPPDVGDPVFQPGSLDQDLTGNRIGEVADWIPYPFGGETTTDVGWFRVDDDIDYNPRIHNAGRVGTQPRDPDQGDNLLATGRTSGFNRFEVTDPSVDIAINFDQGRVIFRDVIEVENWSAGGDSGSPVAFDDGEPFTPAGLHFAGSNTTSFACKMTNVLDETGLEIINEVDDGGQTAFNVSDPVINIDGSSVNVRYRVANQGDAAGTDTVTVRADLGVDGSIDDAVDVDHTLDPGEDVVNGVTFNFDVSSDTDVEACVGVDSRNINRCGVDTIPGQSSGPVFDAQVTNTSAGTSSATVDYEVTNTGSAAGDVSVNVTADIGANGSVNKQVTRSYNIGASGSTQDSVTFSVEQEATVELCVETV